MHCAMTEACLLQLAILKFGSQEAVAAKMSKKATRYWSKDEDDAVHSGAYVDYICALQIPHVP